MPRNIRIAIAAVSVLAPLALVPTSVRAQPAIPYFSRSTLGPNFGIQQPSTPNYAPSFAPSYSNPSASAGCAGQRGQQCAGERLHGNLSGIWSVTYPGGPLRVRVVHRGSSLVATLLDGNIAVPAGKVTIQTHGVGSRTFLAEQICAYPGYIGAHFVGVRMIVAEDGKSMKEEVIGSCGAQASVEWSKVN
jgi:hypothetical protein